MSRITAFFTVVCLLFAVGCGGSNSTTTSNSTSSSQPVFVTASDAPLPAVVGFNITVNSITLTGGASNVSLLSQPTTVDFARLVGTHTLLAFNSVPEGSYTGATITLASPVISYLTTNPAQPVATLNGTLTSSTVSVTFPHALNVSSSGLVGLHFHFNLRDSLQVDSASQITGVVDPKIALTPVAPHDPDAKVDDLRGALVSVNTATSSFVIERMGGRQITVVVNSSTQFSNGASLATLATPAMIEVEGTIQADGSILATSVEVVAVHNGFVAGKIVAVSPATGAAQTVTVLVSQTLPAMNGVSAGTPVTIDISHVQNFDILRMHNWMSSFVFNASSLVVGQHVAITGTVNTSATPGLEPQRIVLMPQGVEGNLVADSVHVTSGNAGTFQIQNNGLIGYLLGAPIDVSTSTTTRFVNVSGLSGLTTGKVAAVGLMLKDPSTGSPRLYAQGVIVPQ